MGGGKTMRYQWRDTDGRQTNVDVRSSINQADLFPGLGKFCPSQPPAVAAGGSRESWEIPPIYQGAATVENVHHAVSSGFPGRS